MKSLKYALISLAALFAATAQAESDGIAELRGTLAANMPSLPVTSISESPLPGIYEVVSGARVFYLTKDAKFMLDGSIIDVERRVNLSSEARGKAQFSAVENIGEENMLVYAAKGDKPARSITIFTDASCPYCQKLHQEIGTLQEAGIAVRYLLYPRAGMKSASAKQLESVWCADNPQKAMDDAKAGKDVAEKSCENPIAQHVEVAHAVGLRGTPMLFLDDGTVIPGYRPAKDLVKMFSDSEPLAMN